MQNMEKQPSSWFNVQNVPASYIFPLEDRPGNLPILICDSIPVINLAKSTGEEKNHTIQHIIGAAQEFRLFQLTDHGIPEDVITETMNLYKEFIDMPEEERAKIPSDSGCVYTSSTSFTKYGVHLWRDCLKHPCHPLEECTFLWPHKPTRYRKVVATYLAEIRKLSLRILEMISRGLGLEPEYLGEMSEVQILTANSYPACPDPSLTLGILRHCDPSLVTILHQGDICGLQLFKEGKWIGVQPLPNAFVVIIGNQIEIISNGKLRGAEHRAVTNRSKARRTIAMLINPSPSCVVEPAKELINGHNPPRYEPTLYKDFVYDTKGFGPRTGTIQNYATGTKIMK